MPKRKRGRPPKNQEDLEKCPKCGKPGWRITKRHKRNSGIYIQNWFEHYSPDGYKKHGMNSKEGWRWCYLGSGGRAPS